MKKIVAMMLALTLVLVSVSAMAAYESATSSAFTLTEDNWGVAERLELTIKKGYSINNEKDADDTDKHPGDVLTLNLKTDTKYYFNGVENSSVTVPALTITTASPTVTEGKDKYDFKVKLPDFTGKPVGEYVWYLYESDGKTAGVTYTYTEESPLILKVTLINKTNSTTGEIEKDENGNAVIIVGGIALRQTSGDNPGNANNSTKKLDSSTGTIDDVHNNYDKGKLTVEKTVKGNMGDTTKPWIFKADFETTNSEVVRGTIYLGGTTGKTGTYYGETAPTADASTGVVTGTPSTDTTIVPGNDGWTTKTVYFTLTSGQDFTFDNIPEGVKYTITEVEANKYDYQTTASGDTDTMTRKGDKTASFENKKDSTPDTGIALDAVPYMMIMAIALMGAAMMIVRRREEM